MVAASLAGIVVVAAGVAAAWLTVVLATGESVAVYSVSLREVLDPGPPL